jgi:hypothetical protein
LPQKSAASSGQCATLRASVAAVGSRRPRAEGNSKSEQRAGLCRHRWILAPRRRSSRAPEAEALHLRRRGRRRTRWPPSTAGEAASLRSARLFLARGASAVGAGADAPFFFLLLTAATISSSRRESGPAPQWASSPAPGWTSVTGAGGWTRGLGFWLGGGLRRGRGGVVVVVGAAAGVGLLWKQTWARPRTGGGGRGGSRRPRTGDPLPLFSRPQRGPQGRWCRAGGARERGPSSWQSGKGKEQKGTRKREKREGGEVDGLQRRPEILGMRDGRGRTAFCKLLCSNCRSLNSSKPFFILNMQRVMHTLLETVLQVSCVYTSRLHRIG